MVYLESLTMTFYENKKLAHLATLLINANLTIAAAESCTGGLIQNAFSQTKHAMKFFQGGMTVYNAGQKAKHLHINPIKAENCNSVSKAIADKMALEVAKKFNAEIGISITGYAEPIPDQNIMESFAFIAFSKDGEIVLSKRIKGDQIKNLAENQILYVTKIIEHLIKIVEVKS